MHNIFFTGITIGILISAPMGPIGLLCIQRTLNKGRWHGFFSGAGASVSDLIYATITCLGMGIVFDFIQKYQDILQIAGSLLLMLFGFYIYRSNPSKSLRKPKETANTYSQDAITAFLLTLSNPFIIFLLIALFARFNFISAGDKLYLMILGLGGIVAGALLWWFLITTLVGSLRKNFNLRGLLVMNRAVGVVIIILSLAGIILSIWEIVEKSNLGIS